MCIRDRCQRGTADNVIGGLKGHCLFNDEEVCAEIYPLILDREQFVWEGGAVIRISTSSRKRLSVKFGNGDTAFMHLSPNPGMAGSNIDCEHGACEMEEGYVMVSRKHLSLIHIFITSNLMLGFEKKQAVLQELHPVKRLKLLSSQLENEMNILSIENEINEKAKEHIDQGQREYFLREQIDVYKRQDGGLFVPERLPVYTYKDLTALAHGTYAERAEKILGDFLEDFTRQELCECVHSAYETGRFDGNRPEMCIRDRSNTPAASPNLSVALRC